MVEATPSVDNKPVGAKRPGRPWYAAASVGRARFLWCAWKDFDALGEGTPSAFGHEATREAAEAKAYEAALPLSVPGGEGPVKALSVWALGWRSQCAQEKRARRVSSADGAAVIEFLYHGSYFSDDYGNCGIHWTPHRIVKRTAKRVFVVRETYKDCEATYSLDRRTLEREGRVRVGSKWWSGDFYTQEAYERERRAEMSRGVPWFLAELGLTSEASLEGVKSAFRAKARDTHPDTGGDSEAFKRLRRAYEESLAWAQQRQGKEWVA